MDKYFRYNALMLGNFAFFFIFERLSILKLRLLNSKQLASGNDDEKFDAFESVSRKSDLKHPLLNNA